MQKSGIEPKTKKEKVVRNNQTSTGESSRMQCIEVEIFCGRDPIY